MKMEEINKDKPDQHGDTILVARFTMVARDADTGKAAQVNPLLLRDDNEKKLFQMGEGIYLDIVDMLKLFVSLRFICCRLADKHLGQCSNTI